MTTGVLPRGQSGQGEKLTIHLRLVSRLRINGGIPLVPLHAFMAWPGKNRYLSFFCKVWPYLRQKRRWMVGGMGSKLLKRRGRDCNRLLFRNFFVGTEKNHENIGIAGDLVEFRPTYKFKALPLQQPARSEVMLVWTWYTASETHGNFAQWVFIKRKVFSTAKDVLYAWICGYRLRDSTIYRGADKSLARPTSRCIFWWW